MSAEVGDVIQILPVHAHAFALWIVDAVKPWGVIAYCDIPGTNGQMYVRLPWGKFAIIGKAVYVLGDNVWSKSE